MYAGSAFDASNFVFFTIDKPPDSKESRTGENVPSFWQARLKIFAPSTDLSRE
jgi:hypothetical protein